MRYRAASLLLLLSLLFADLRSSAQDSPGLPPTEVQMGTKTTSSVSSTKQFVVHGADLSVRSTFCLLCEEVAASLGRLLKDDGKYTIPIVIAVKTPPDVVAQMPAVQPNITMLTHGGFHLQVTAQLRSDFRGDDFNQELVRVLLAERILRNQKDVNTERERMILPEWMLTGVLQAMEFRSRNKPSVLFAAVFKSGQVYSIDRILAANPKNLDAMARGIYEVSSCALVLTLLDQPDGPLRVQRFLAALATDTRPDRDLLQQHFPTLGASKNSLEKWWTLQLAALATPSAFESMTVKETEEYLDKALTLYYTERVGEEPKELAEAAKEGKGIFGWLKRDKKPAATDPAAPVPSLPAKAGPTGVSANVSALPPPVPTDADLPPLPLPLQPGAAPMNQTLPDAVPPPEPAPATGGTPGNAPTPPAPPTDAPPEGGPPMPPTPGDLKPEPAPAPAPPSPDKPAPAPDAEKDKPVPADDKPKPAPKPKPSSTPKKKSPPAEEKPAEKTEPEKKEEEPRRFRFPKIFGGGKSVTYTLLFIAAAVAEAAPPPSPPADASSKPPSLPRRNHRVSSKPEDLPAPAASSQPAPAPAPAPKPAPAEKPKPEAEAEATDVDKKPNRFNPRNWFKKDKPKDEETTNSPPAEKEPTSPRPQRRKPEAPQPAAPSPENDVPEPGKTGPPPEPEAKPLPKVNPNSVVIENYQRIWKRADRSDILQRNLVMLSGLQQRAHPLYRSLVDEYVAVVQQLAKGTDKGAAAKLEVLRQRRAQILRRAKSVESYLDWYEANETETFSHMFDDYMKLRERLEKERAPRGDAMSQYLDKLEKEYD